MSQICNTELISSHIKINVKVNNDMFSDLLDLYTLHILACLCNFLYPYYLVIFVYVYI